MFRNDDQIARPARRRFLPVSVVDTVIVYSLPEDFDRVRAKALLERALHERYANKEE